MNKMLSHFKLLTRMKADHLSLKFTKQFSEDQLDQACERIERYELQDLLIERQELFIQQELIETPAFAQLYLRLCGEKVSPYCTDEMIKSSRHTQEHLTDYPQELVLEAAKQDIGALLRFQYMKYYLPVVAFEEEKEAILHNLRLLPAALKNIGDLTESQRDMLRLPYVGEYMFSESDHDRNSLDLLAANAPLRAILALLYENQVGVELTQNSLQALQWLHTDDVGKFRRLLEVMEHDSEDVGDFIRLWLENNAAQYDLDWFVTQPQPLNKERRKEILHGQLSYLNALYSGRLHIDFERTLLRNYQVNILIYAVQNRKKHFLDLVDRNSETFLSLARYSLLFVKEFREHCNLNSLSVKDLEKCNAVSDEFVHFDLLESGRQYTFGEMYLLWRAPQQYVKLYTKLTPLAVDRRILTLQQLLKHDLLGRGMTEENLDQLAQCLLQRTFSQWYEGVFGHIQGLTRRTAIQLLAQYGQVEGVISDLQTEADAVFTVNNAAGLAEYPTWARLRNSILTVDRDWQYLKEKMHFSDDFVAQHQKNILDFLLRGGSAMVRPLYDYLNKEGTKGQEALRRVVQAEVMGQFYKLKYFTDDLRRELQYPIDTNQEEIWKQNTCMKRGRLAAEEIDDFYHTIQIGELPYPTCLSYLSGGYRECVLAAFDSNKKMILVYKDGCVVARACIRLTKGSFQQPQKENFEFADLAGDSSMGRQKQQERLILFLEVPYIHGLNNQETQAVEELLVSLAETKAASMGVLPVLAGSYSDAYPNRQYIYVQLYMFISKSKSGKQYLDSLGGAAVTSDKETYKRGAFLTREADLDASEVI